MIKGIHGMFYSSKAEELRSFLKDKLALPFTDTGGGWLIFDLATADLGVHPTDGEESMSGTHDISFFTDDVKGTVKELESRGVKFDDTIADRPAPQCTAANRPRTTTGTRRRARFATAKPRWHFVAAARGDDRTAHPSEPHDEAVLRRVCRFSVLPRGPVFLSEAGTSVVA